MELFRRPLSYEQREGVLILAYARWAMLAALLFTIPYHLRNDPPAAFLVSGLMAVAAALNGLLHWHIRQARPLPIAAGIAVSVADAIAVTVAIAVILGFDNSAYVLYYPSLMSICALFPGRISLTYSAAIIVTYTLLSTTIYARFDSGSLADWHALGLRITTMALTVVVAYLLVRVERLRRIRAVAAEAERQQQILALEEHARAMEREADEERRRLTREIHDGISQGLYVLSLGLEDIAARADAQGQPRLNALVHLSKQTLFDARGLLLDLHEAKSGHTPLQELIARQADEFQAVTGIATTVSVSGEPIDLTAGTVAATYRILQESLANIYKHASATSARIDLHFEDGSIQLRLCDNGRGFDASEPSARGHGLRSMRERATAIGGQMTIDSSIGGGTMLTLTIARPEVMA